MQSANSDPEPGGGGVGRAGRRARHGVADDRAVPDGQHDGHEDPGRRDEDGHAADAGERDQRTGAPPRAVITHASMLRAAGTPARASQRRRVSGHGPSWGGSGYRTRVSQDEDGARPAGPPARSRPAPRPSAESRTDRTPDVDVAPGHGAPDADDPDHRQSGRLSRLLRRRDDDEDEGPFFPPETAPAAAPTGSRPGPGTPSPTPAAAGPRPRPRARPQPGARPASVTTTDAAAADEPGSPGEGEEARGEAPGRTGRVDISRFVEATAPEKERDKASDKASDKAQR